MLRVIHYNEASCWTITEAYSWSTVTREAHVLTPVLSPTLEVMRRLLMQCISCVTLWLAIVLSSYVWGLLHACCLEYMAGPPIRLSLCILLLFGWRALGPSGERDDSLWRWWLYAVSSIVSYYCTSNKRGEKSGEEIRICLLWSFVLCIQSLECDLTFRCIDDSSLVAIHLLPGMKARGEIGRPHWFLVSYLASLLNLLISNIFGRDLLLVVVRRYARHPLRQLFTQGPC